MKKAIALLLTFIVALCTACAGEPTAQEFYNEFSEKTKQYTSDCKAYSSFLESKSYNIAKDYIEKAKLDIEEIVNLKYPSKYKTLFEDMVIQSKREKEYIDIVIEFCDYAKVSDSLTQDELVKFNNVVTKMGEYLDSFEDKSFPRAIVSLTLAVKKDIQE